MYSLASLSSLWRWLLPQVNGINIRVEEDGMSFYVSKLTKIHKARKNRL
jgi:hypothetical protein